MLADRGTGASNSGLERSSRTDGPLLRAARNQLATTGMKPVRAEPSSRGEHPLGSRWPTLGPLDEHDRSSIPVPFEMPSTRYGGTGSDWDASKNRHVRGLVLSTAFARALGLRRFDDFLWSAAGHGVVAANFGVREHCGPDVLFIRRDHLERWMARTGSTLFTTATAEMRLLYPDLGRRERDGEPLIRSLPGTHFFDAQGSRFVSGSARTLHARRGRGPLRGHRVDPDLELS